MNWCLVGLLMVGFGTTWKIVLRKMIRGWHELQRNGQVGKYYFTPVALEGYPKGAMLYGVLVINGIEYSFDDSGRLIE